MSAVTSTEIEQSGQSAAPAGTVHIVDPHPLNWLFITWNTMEEPVRTDHEGYTVMALAESAQWRDDRTLEVKIRPDTVFQDGEPCTAHSIRQNFDEVQRWAAPHPPGTYLNFHPDAACVVEDELTCVFTFPVPDGLALGKFRGFHIASSSFWLTHGFGYKKTGSGEGHW
jgi:ABC-type transport system substrate-binding protein